MEKEFIPYEQALELKELGFNEKCLASYICHKEVRFDIQEQSGICWHSVKNSEFEGGEHCAIPLYQQAFRWFREKHQCESSIIAMFLPYEHYKEYQFIITYTESEIVEANFNTYEEAELACLKKLIEVVKNK